MAFPDDSPPYQETSKSPLMQYDSNALFGMMLQFGAGIVTVYMYGVALSFIGVVIPSLPPGWPINYIGLIVEIILIPLGLLQIFSGWRLYRKESGSVKFAIILDVLSILLHGIITISAIGVYGFLTSPESMVVLIGMNIIAILLLTRTGVEEKLEASKPIASVY